MKTKKTKKRYPKFKITGRYKSVDEMVEATTTKAFREKYWYPGKAQRDKELAEWLKETNVKIDTLKAKD